MVQKFREITKNHLNVNCRDINFMVAHRCFAAPVQTVHVATPTNLACGIGLDVG